MGGGPTAREPERVERSEVLEGVQPRLFLRSEHGGFLVDAPAAGVGVSEEQERTAAPATEQGEVVRVEYVLPAARAVRDVDCAERQRARGFDGGGEPATGLSRLRPETEPAQRPARGDEKAIRVRPRAIRRRALMHEADGGEGARERPARRRRTELAQRHRVRRPALELASDALDAHPAAGADVPEDDSHVRAPVDAYGLPSDASRSSSAALANAHMFVSRSPRRVSRVMARSTGPATAMHA